MKYLVTGTRLTACVTNVDAANETEARAKAKELANNPHNFIDSDNPRIIVEGVYISSEDEEC